MLNPSQNIVSLSRHNVAERVDRSSFGKLLAVHGVFSALTLWVVFQQATDFNQALARGMFIPDVVNMTQTFDNLWRLYGIVPYEPSFSGVSIIYGWTWLISPSIAWFINNIFMFAAGYVYIKYLVPRLRLDGWAVLVVYANPYLILASVGPNKEIPLILMSLIWLSLLLSSHSLKWPLAFLLSFAAYFIRDGFGFILLMATVFSIIWGSASRKVPVSMLAFGGFVSIAFGVLVQYSDTLARNLAVLEQGFDQGTAIGAIAEGMGLNPSSLTGGLALYFIRLIYNALVLGIFPNLNTIFGYWNLLGVSYWVTGILIIISIISSGLIIIYDKIDKNVGGPIFLFFLTCLFAISISQFVQPRYLMPAIPIGLCTALYLPPSMRKKVYTATLVLIISVVMLYGLAGKRPAAEVIAQIETPAFVWFD